jgi:hypothetical protein
MALDRLQNSALTRAFTDLLGDLGNLVQKEMQLAKAEIIEKSAWPRKGPLFSPIAGVGSAGAAILDFARCPERRLYPRLLRIVELTFSNPTARGTRVRRHACDRQRRLRTRRRQPQAMRPLLP